MKVALYNLFILFYQFAALIISPFNAKARAFTIGRRGQWTKIKQGVSKQHNQVAWFHCASLGEFEQGKPVMEAYRSENPEYQILVTFFSPSGYEERKNTEVADYVSYLPVDRPSYVSRFLETVNPRIVFFIKYEFWYNYLYQIHKRGIPIYNISGLFTTKHGFFKSDGFQRKMLTFFNHFFVQNDESKQLLSGIGFNNVTISGDTRFDRVLQTINNPNSYPTIASFKGDHKLCIIGSSWPEDMEVLYEFINSDNQGVKFVIAPHLADDHHIQVLEKGLKVPSIRFSNYQGSAADKVLIIDSMGMLSSVYQYGDFAYIGGAFRDGVHNILEAVAFGLPVVFGNRYLDKFPETLELIELGGAFSISEKNGASDILYQLMTDEDNLQEASRVCTNYVHGKAGATQVIMNFISKN